MAYYIDEAGKRGLKAEGRQFFAWDFDARKFVSPVDDAPPKSRMRRCSEFEAKEFNFLTDETDWVDEVDSITDATTDFTGKMLPKLEDADLETLRKCQEEAEAFSEKWLTAAKEAYSATVRYGLENCPLGEEARDAVKSIENFVEIPKVLIRAKEAGESTRIRFEGK